ncbi:alpha/beta hydrolase [Rhodococcus rhodnii]|nr:alpha/beta hydrolase [Rhodococcus rhodnii]TXG92519.1 alpha/beta hydrolase [Rhodococcus rhodnii]
MSTVELAAGPIDYLDTGGSGPVVVLSHGFPMNHLQWRKVIPLLDDLRCIAPTFPLGAHRTAMRRGTDLSQRGQAMIVADFLDALDLRDVTLVMNDWGGPQFFVAFGRDERVGRLVFAACEAFDNFPPPPARPPAALARVPGGAWLLAQAMRTRLLRHGSKGYGAMCHARIPEDVLDSWFDPAVRDAGVRADMRAFATGAPPRRVALDWSEALRGFERPALVVWARDDLMMPGDHGRRLAEILPNATLVEIEESRTLIPEDRPDEFAAVLREFVLGSAPGP